jgi:hypothetical protein
MRVFSSFSLSLFESMMNSSDWTHFSLSPKICSHWLSNKQCQLGFSGIMSVAVSSTSHFHSSATLSLAVGACKGIHQIFFTICRPIISRDILGRIWVRIAG